MNLKTKVEEQLLRKFLWEASIGYNDPFVNLNKEVLQKFADLVASHYLTEGYHDGFQDCLPSNEE